MLKKITKKITKSSLGQHCLAYIGAFYIHFIYWTNRWSFEDMHYGQEVWGGEKPFIAAFWHGRLMLMRKALRVSIPFSMFISDHSDGKIIAKIMALLSIRTIYSSRNAGSKGLLALRQALAKGFCVGITPDGPRGPIFQAKKGTFMLAYLSGCVTIPVAFSTSRHRRLKSWDQFFLPLPFGKGVFVYGKPIPAPLQKDEQSCQNFLRCLELSLKEACERADALCCPSG
jgi:lysophospholipid acyltransferase (LPLAT)-like uncharacterized protein